MPRPGLGDEAPPDCGDYAMVRYNEGMKRHDATLVPPA